MKQSKYQLPHDEIAKLSARSNAPLRQIMHYLAGAPPPPAGAEATNTSAVVEGAAAPPMSAPAGQVRYFSYSILTWSPMGSALLRPRRAPRSFVFPIRGRSLCPPFVVAHATQLRFVVCNWQRTGSVLFAFCSIDVVSVRLEAAFPAELELKFLYFGFASHFAQPTCSSRPHLTRPCWPFFALSALPAQGLRGDFQVIGDLKRITTMAKFIVHCVLERDLINKQNNLFFQVSTTDGKVNFMPPNAVYQPIYATLDDGKNPCEEAFAAAAFFTRRALLNPRGALSSSGPSSLGPLHRLLQSVLGSRAPLLLLACLSAPFAT